MNNFARSILITCPFLCIIGCGKDQSSKSESPLIVELTPVQPVVPLPTDNANTSDNQQTDTLLSLPATGIPLGFTSWDEFNAADPELRSLKILDGRDPTQELLGEDPRCSIYIMAAYRNNEGLPTFVIRTSFSHNMQTHEFLLVSVPNLESMSAKGTGLNAKDQIYFKLSKAGDFYSVSLMNLKWFHINHFDTGVCESLKIRTS